MRNSPIQQEVLLVASTVYSYHQLNQNKRSGTIQLSPAEQMEEACWDGLLQEMVPEIIGTSVSSKRLYLWNVRSREYLIQIDLSEFPMSTENKCSIDPWRFMLTLLLN